MTKPTVWIMMVITINVRENGDSRYTSHELFDDVEILQADTMDELQALIYGYRENSKKYAPGGAYGSGTLHRYVGPFEVEHNAAWSNDNSTIDTWFESHHLTEERPVNEWIDKGEFLHKILK